MRANTFNIISCMCAMFIYLSFHWYLIYSRDLPKICKYFYWCAGTPSAELQCRGNVTLVNKFCDWYTGAISNKKPFESQQALNFRWGSFLPFSSFRYELQYCVINALQRFFTCIITEALRIKLQAYHVECFPLRRAYLQWLQGHPSSSSNGMICLAICCL